MKCRAVPLLLAIALLLGGCESGIHDMYKQPRYAPLEPSPLFSSGNSAQPPPLGTLATSAGVLADSSSGRLGDVRPAPPAGPALPIGASGRAVTEQGGQRSYANPLAVTADLLKRGRERFNIYCAPCHGRDGYGDGMIARRGFPAPPSYHSARLRKAPDSHFYQVITHGYGVMYPYADRVDTHDRWAIVAWIRTLQLSQHAPLSALDAGDVAALDTLGGTP
ncbi:MAG TPA: cytochrome c [Rhodanobacteraceae bacterium]|nr:cytochrome c [Rhodanobacteraceae bacterium]